jgi:hypothetical protein
MQFNRWQLTKLTLTENERSIENGLVARNFSQKSMLRQEQDVKDVKSNPIGFEIK